MEITKTIGNPTKKEQYLMTLAPNIGRVKDIVGAKLEITKAVLFDDIDKEGEIHELLTIMTTEGEIYATNSRTFRKSFNDIAGIFIEDNDNVCLFIEVIRGKSKSDREFVDCLYIGD